MQLLQFILGIAVLILLHEFGHFAVARLFKVEIEEFGIGFPPRMIKLFEHNGTEYTVNWIPLGGFVRPKGENDPTVPGGLAAANPWVRLAVLFAGPAMNLLIAAVLGMALFYSIGDPIENKVTISYVEPGSPAEEAGLQTGDLFLQIDNEVIDSTDKLLTLISQKLGQPITVVVDRSDETITVTLVPRASPPEGQGPMGIGLSNLTQPISLVTAMQRGTIAAYESGRGIMLIPVRMLSGDVEPQEGRVVGYKGMYDIYQRLQNPLWFFMMISLSLGIMNLLPIPALDGGRILLTLPEILIRRRIPAEYENVIHMIGLAMLLLLMIYINIQDFINPIQLP